ncbi:MAG: helix-turn-helix transcriptional regulator [Eubacterium sp.]|nr:helix-turn-helix transcriptional regulator [Eubacterium sp.]
MIVSDIKQMANNLLSIRKKMGYTQAEAAEKAGISERTYADIERGSTNMRIATMINICRALQITPDDIFTIRTFKPYMPNRDNLFDKLDKCTRSDQESALMLLDAFLRTL